MTARKTPAKAAPKPAAAQAEPQPKADEADPAAKAAAVAEVAAQAGTAAGDLAEAVKAAARVSAASADELADAVASTAKATGATAAEVLHLTVNAEGYDGINMRCAPHREAPVAGELRNGQAVRCVNLGDGWMGVLSGCARTEFLE